MRFNIVMRFFALAAMSLLVVLTIATQITSKVENQMVKEEPATGGKAAAQQTVVSRKPNSFKLRQLVPLPMAEQRPGSEEEAKAAQQAMKEAQEWTNMWTKVESGNGDMSSLKKLVSLGRTNYGAEVRAALARIMDNRHYPVAYRAEVIRDYIVLYENRMEGSLVPNIITRLEDSEPLVKTAAHDLLLLISDEQEARSYLPQLEETAARHPEDSQIKYLVELFIINR